VIYLLAIFPPNRGVDFYFEFLPAKTGSRLGKYLLFHTRKEERGLVAIVRGQTPLFFTSITPPEEDCTPTKTDITDESKTMCRIGMISQRRLIVLERWDEMAG